MFELMRLVSRWHLCDIMVANLLVSCWLNLYDIIDLGSHHRISSFHNFLYNQSCYTDRHLCAHIKSKEAFLLFSWIIFSCSGWTLSVLIIFSFISNIASHYLTFGVVIVCLLQWYHIDLTVWYLSMRLQRYHYVPIAVVSRISRCSKSLTHIWPIFRVSLNLY